MLRNSQNVNGKRIAYEKVPGNPWIVFLHGFCEDKSVWHGFTDKFVENGCGILAIDLPGFGDSDSIAAISIDKMADYVYTVVIELLKGSPFLLVGHSMGGYVGLSFAEKYEECLSGLCLFHSHPFEDTDLKKEARQKSIDFIERNGHHQYVKELFQNLFGSGYKEKHPEVVENLVAKAQKYKSEGIMAGLAAMKERKDKTHVLSKMTKPILFIVGSQDKTVTYEQSLDQTHFPSTSSLLVLEEVSHMGMFEEPDPIQDQILSFITFCEEMTR